MYTSTYPTRCKRLATASLITLLLAACASLPEPAPAPSPQPPHTPSVTQLPAEPAPPSIIIQGRSARAILDSVAKYRTQKGMRVLERSGNHIKLGMAVPRSNPPAEALMIFSIAPAPEAPSGLRLSAQVFQQIKQANKSSETEITASLRNELEEELNMYAKQK